MIRPRAIVTALLLGVLSLAGGSGSLALRGDLRSAVRASDDQQVSIAQASSRASISTDRQRRTTGADSRLAALPAAGLLHAPLGAAAVVSRPARFPQHRDPALTFPYDATAPPTPRD